MQHLGAHSLQEGRVENGGHRPVARIAAAGSPCPAASCSPVPARVAAARRGRCAAAVLGAAASLRRTRLSSSTASGGWDGMLQRRLWWLAEGGVAWQVHPIVEAVGVRAGEERHQLRQQLLRHHFRPAAAAHL